MKKIKSFMLRNLIYEMILRKKLSSPTTRANTHIRKNGDSHFVPTKPNDYKY